MNLTELSVEQQFAVEAFKQQLKDISLEQAKDFMAQMYVQILHERNNCSYLLKHPWFSGVASEAKEVAE